MPAAARRDNRSATYQSTDTDNRLTNTDPMWDGSQARQATWFNEKLKRAEADFEFHQLCQSTTVTMSKSGAIAVFSPEHALEHAQGTNKGTMRAPSNRKREDLLARSLAKATAATASPTPAGAQGVPPTPTSVPVPTTTTYAAAAATYAAAASKPTTMLEDMLGELASNYRLSSETIEKAHSSHSSTTSSTA